MRCKQVMSVSDYAGYVQRNLPQSAILMQLAEECAEAAQAALKLARIQQGVNPTPAKADETMALLTEELADIAVCADCIMDIDFCAIDRIHDKKIARWVARLAKANRK